MRLVLPEIAHRLSELSSVGDSVCGGIDFKRVAPHLRKALIFNKSGARSLVFRCDPGERLVCKHFLEPQVGIFMVFGSQLHRRNE